MTFRLSTTLRTTNRAAQIQATMAFWLALMVGAHAQSSPGFVPGTPLGTSVNGITI